MVSRQFSPETDRLADYSVWLQALLATAVIGLAPVLILAFIPSNIGSNNPKSQGRLKILLAFAVGGLLGDVFLHLLPHAMEHHSHEQEHSHGNAGLWVLTGILLFLVIEKFILTFSSSGHGHSHSHGIKMEPSIDDQTDINHVGEQKSNVEQNLRHRGDKHSARKHEQNNSPGTQMHDVSEKRITPAAYLNVAADFTHNFTDGLAIGSSFLLDSKIGIVTVLAVLLHEIPHEIGDFALLIQAGFSRKAAIRTQIWTALGAMVGAVIGLLAEGATKESSWIMPMTAGGFLYISMSSVIPELLKPTTPTQSIKEVFAIMLGIGMMATISLLE